jgi:hypothetical protein
MPDARRALAGLRCACGSGAILAIRPGLEPARRGATDIVTRSDPLVARGAPDAAWCAVCWLARWGAPWFHWPQPGVAPNAYRSLSSKISKNGDRNGDRAPRRKG